MDHAADISGNYVCASEGKLQNARNRDVHDLQHIKGALCFL